MKQLLYTALLILSSFSCAMDRVEPTTEKNLEKIRKKISFLDAIRTNSFTTENSRIFFQPYDKADQEEIKYHYTLKKAGRIVKECDDFIKILLLTRWIGTDEESLNDDSEQSSSDDDDTWEKKNQNENDSLVNLLALKPLCPEYCQQVLSTEQHFNQHINFNQALVARRLDYIAHNPEYRLFAMAQLMNAFYLADHARYIKRTKQERQIKKEEMAKSKVCYASEKLKKHEENYRPVTQAEKAQFRQVHNDLKIAFISQDSNGILSTQKKIIPAQPFNDEIAQMSANNYETSLNPILQIHW